MSENMKFDFVAPISFPHIFRLYSFRAKRKKTTVCIRFFAITVFFFFVIAVNFCIM